MKKKAIGLFLAAAMAFGLFACGNDGGGGEAKQETQKAEDGKAEGEEKESGAGEVTTVTLWSFKAEDNDPTAASSRLKKLIDDFNASHNDIQIEVSFGKTYDNVVTAIASQDTPDIFDMYWQYASPLAARGALYDLTEFVENDTEFEKDDFLERVWDLCTVDGKIYSIPNLASSSFAVYNKNVLKEAGWDSFPTTFDDMIQCAKDCYDLESTSMGMNPLSPWLDNVLWPAMTEAGWIDAEGNPVFDSEEMRLAYSAQKELIEYQGGYAEATGWEGDFGPARGSVTDPVLTGEAGFLLLPDSAIPTIYNAGVEAGYIYGKDWGVAQVPGNSMFTAGVYEMNAKTKNPEAAWEVMSYLNSKEAMIYLAEGEKGVGALMPRKSALDALQEMDGICEALKEVAVLLEEAELQSFPMSGYVNEYLGAIGNNMTAYMEGSLDMDTAVSNIQAEVQAAADAFNGK